MRCASKGERHIAIRRVHHAAIELAKQIGHIIRGEIDHALLQGFGFGQGNAFAYGFFGPIDIAMPRGGNRAGVCGRVIHNFLRDYAAREKNRMRRADVRAGRHGRDVGGKNNEASRGCGARPARCNENDYRHARVHFRLHDFAHGGVEAAGRVELQNHG